MEKINLSVSGDELVQNVGVLLGCTGTGLCKESMFLIADNSLSQGSVSVELLRQQRTSAARADCLCRSTPGLVGQLSMLGMGGSADLLTG